MNFLYNDVFKQFSVKDLEEIEKMQEPSLYQAETLVVRWNRFYAGQSTSNETDMFLAKATAKCVQRCKQSYPELFI